MRQILFAALLALPCAFAADDSSDAVTRRNDGYAQELERYFQRFLVDDYPQRAAGFWRRDYGSTEAYLKSVAPNRKRYGALFSPPDFRPAGPATRRPHPAVPGAEWLTIPLEGGLKAEALLMFPSGAAGRAPLVIAQHGIGSFPERVFGHDDAKMLYKDYGHALVREGYAVLAPLNLFSIEKRNRIERLARLAGTTLPGLEFRRMQVLLDEVLRDKRIDAGRVGMWGISLGGMATMFWTPVEPRIGCAIVTAWFNHRRNKMAIPDPRYSCFLETKEEHAFFSGWLTEFTDSDVASLICPRPMLVQHGKKDGIAHWPQVMEEFEASREHYRKLGMADRISIDMHEGGHEIRLESGLPFLNKWLKK